MSRAKLRNYRHYTALTRSIGIIGSVKMTEEDIWSRFITAVSLYIKDPAFAYELAIFYIKVNPVAYVTPILTVFYFSVFEVLYFFGLAKKHCITNIMKKLSEEQ